MIFAKMPIIDAVLVTYFPEKELLSKVIHSIADQVRFIYIVDNTPSLDWTIDGSSNSIIIRQGENFGISQAQNMGIKRSMSENSDYILLSDQDTLYPEDFVTKMLESYDSLNQRVVALVPLFKDVNHLTDNEGFIIKGKLGFKRIFPITGNTNILHAIASGMVIRTNLIDQVGLMDEDLFIDWVDIEWCWRANKKGYLVVGNADVCVTHRLGDVAVNVGFRDVNIRSPIRHYFITRNAFYLSLYTNNLDSLHKIILFIKSFRYIVGFPILSRPHFLHLKFVLKGMLHGVNRQLGKYR
jgi:rhamnosyltransferase